MENSSERQSEQPSTLKQPLVILLHGITQSARHLQPMALFLSRQGYPTAPLSYAWRDISFTEVVAECRQKIQNALHTVFGDSSTPDYLIFAHSMGCLITRALLAKADVPPPKLVVMSGPPNQGSESADKLKDFPPFKWIYGSLGWQLGTQPDAIIHRLPPTFPETIPLGVIAGDRSAFPLLDRLLPRPNDGKVSLASTHLPGEQDHVILPVNHDNMFKHRLVCQATLDFIQQRRFTNRPLDDRYPELAQIATPMRSADFHNASTVNSL